jgi:hypothetical protein
LFGLFIASCLTALGCGKRGEPKADPPVASAARAPVDSRIDSGLIDVLKQMARDCEVNVQDANVLCHHDEDQKLVSEFVADQRSQIWALPTMTAALKDADPKLQTVAADVLYLAFRVKLGRDARPGSVSADDARSLVDTVVALPKPQSRQAIATAVHASMLARQGQQLYHTLDEPKNQPLATIGYRHLMTYGRLDAFEKVKQLSRDSNTALVLAALNNPENMLDWTDGERAQICPWSQDFLGNAHPAIAAKAGSILAHCGGEYVDALLSKMDRSHKGDAPLTRTDIASMRDLCTLALRGKPGGPSELQCTRDRKLLDRALESTDVEAAGRGQALEALAYDWPDEHSLKLARQYESNKDAVVADFARQTAERLSRRMEKPAPSASTSTSTLASPQRVSGVTPAKPRAAHH